MECRGWGVKHVRLRTALSYHENVCSKVSVNRTSKALRAARSLIALRALLVSPVFEDEN